MQKYMKGQIPSSLRNKKKGLIPENADYCRKQKENVGRLFSILKRMEEEMFFIKYEQTAMG